MFSVRSPIDVVPVRRQVRVGESGSIDPIFDLIVLPAVIIGVLVVLVR